MRLLLRYDSNRGASFLTFIATQLPLKVRSVIYAKRIQAKREQCWSSLVPFRDAADEGYDQQLETVLYHCIAATGSGPVTGRSVEDAVVNRVALEDTLKQLPSRQRDIVRLRIDAYDFEEIAMRVGITKGACYKAFQRARAVLQRTLDED